MNKRFVYFYFMKNDPERIRAAVPRHIEYWKSCNPEGYMGGPFSDRTGGLISFVAQSIEEAANTCAKDPFISENLVEDKWIKEWVVEVE